jgi:hypothetical protein
LVYVQASNEWLLSTSCVWHSTITITHHAPIASAYPHLERFFVGILGTNTLTDVFLMKQLASAAASQHKVAAEIKRLMLSASGLLTMSSDRRKFSESIEVLEQSTFLPCISATGQFVYCSLTDPFFIVDNQHDAEKFRDHLWLLDFSYEHLASLHELFNLLRLQSRYLKRNVRRVTAVESASYNEELTNRIRLCAYPISW